MKSRKHFRNFYSLPSAGSTDIICQESIMLSRMANSSMSESKIVGLLSLSLSSKYRVSSEITVSKVVLRRWVEVLVPILKHSCPDFSRHSQSARQGLGRQKCTECLDSPR